MTFQIKKKNGIHVVSALYTAVIYTSHQKVQKHRKYNRGSEWLNITSVVFLKC